VEVLNLLVWLEALGVVAFALSGIIEAARKKFDLVGVVMVGAIAAFGGGTLRDVLLDRRPFFWVEQEFWVWVLIIAGVTLPFFYKARHIALSEKAMLVPDAFSEKAMLVPDAFGLGIFAAGGTHLALVAGQTPLVSVLMGVITAVAGGILRDVLVNEVPRAFHDFQPYGVIAFAGGWLVVLLTFLNFPDYLNVLISASVMVIVRLLAVRFGWELKRWRFL